MQDNRETFTIDDCKVEFGNVELFGKTCKITHLETGMGIYLIPKNAVEQAALISRESRDVGTFEDRVKKIKSDGTSDEEIKRTVNKFFKNYGHNSIGDCGDLVISFTNVPHYLAYHIWHSRLVNGQETSTRYVDLSENSFIRSSSDEYNQKMSDAMKLFSDVLEEGNKYFLKQGMSEKAAKPAAFDVARGFLPMGARTTVTLNITLRQLVERYHYLKTLSNDLFPHSQVLTLLLDIAIKHNLKEISPNEGTLGKWKIPSYEEQLKYMRYCKSIRHSNERFFKESLRHWRKNLDCSKYDSEKFNSEDDCLELSCLYQPFTAHMSLPFAESRDLNRHREPSRNIFDLEGIEKNDLGDFYKKHLRKFGNGDIVDRTIDHYLWLRDNADSGSSKGIIGCVPMGTVSDHMVVANLQEWKRLLDTRMTGKVHPSLVKALSGVAKDLNSNLAQLGIPISMPEHVDTDYSRRSKDE